MYEFLASIGQWFEAHDLMSAEAGHWVAWVFIVLIPLTVTMWWIWMIDKYMTEYHNEPTKENKFLLYVSYTAPISVPVLFAMTAILWTGRKFKMA